MDDLDLDNIEAAALGKTGVGRFAHPAVTIKLVAEIRRLRRGLEESIRSLDRIICTCPTACGCFCRGECGCKACSRSGVFMNAETPPR